MDILGCYRGVGECYRGHYQFTFHGCTSILPRYAPPIHPYYSLTSEPAKIVSLGLGFFICDVDVPGSENSTVIAR